MLHKKTPYGFFEVPEWKERELEKLTDNQLLKKAIEILKDFNSGYRMGDYKTLFLNGKVFAELDDRYEYANSSKYKANHGVVNVRLNKRQLNYIEYVDGVWTINLGKNEIEWIDENGKYSNYTTSITKGFLVGRSHGKTLEEAQHNEAKKNKISTFNFRDKDFISVDNVRQLGACEAGIDRFCRKHNLKKEFGYKLGFLKTLDSDLAEKYFNRLTKK